MKTAKPPLPPPEALPKSRLAFMPTIKGRKYFWGLTERITQERAQEKGINLRVPQREVFDIMVDLAEQGEAKIRARNVPKKTNSKVA